MFIPIRLGTSAKTSNYSNHLLQVTLCGLLQAFTFDHVGSGKAVKAPKTTQLYRAPPGASNATEIGVGDKYMYRPEGKGEYLVEIVEKATGDDRKFVPRCISGNAGEGGQGADDV